jgi:hypothetical protein
MCDKNIITFKIDANSYYYFNGEVTVKATGWLEVKDFKQVVDMLLW